MPVFVNDLQGIAAQQESASQAAYARRFASPYAGVSVSSLLRDFPWLPPGVAYSLAQTNQTGGQAADVALAELDRQVQADPGQFKRSTFEFGGRKYGSLREAQQAAIEQFDQGFNFNPVKPIVRGAAVAANTAWQGVIGGLRAGQGVIAMNNAQTNALVGDPTKVKERRAAALERVDETYGQQLRREAGKNPLEIIGSQTEGGQALNDLLHGREVDLGSGYLPSPDSPQAQAAAEAARYYSPYLIGGHAWTPGRSIANGLGLQTDTTPFVIVSGLTDAAVAWEADPTAAVLGQLGEARAAQKVLLPTPDAATAVEHALAGNPAGLVEGARPIVRGQDGVTWLLNSDAGQAIRQGIADEPSAYANWLNLNKKIPARLLDSLSSADTPEDVARILAPELGTTIDKAPSYLRGTDDSRWFSPMASRTVNPNDLDETIRGLHHTMLAAKVPYTERAGIIDNLVGAYANGDRYAAVEAGMQAVEKSIVAQGGSPNIAAQLTRMFHNDYAEATRYFEDSVLGGEKTRSLLVDGELMPTDGPVTGAQRLNSSIPLPDSRELRRMVSNVNFLYDRETALGHAVTTGIGALDRFYGFWRPLVLLKPSLAIRNIAEEQASMGVRGSGFFRGPISYLSAVIGDASKDSRIAQWLEKAGTDPTREAMIQALEDQGEEIPSWLRGQRTIGEKAAATVRKTETKLGANTVDITGAPFTRDSGELLGDGLKDSFGTLTGTSRQLNLRQFSSVAADDPKAAQALVSDIARMRADSDLMRAYKMTPDEWAAWGETETGMKWRQNLAAGRDAGDAMAYVASNPETWNSYGDFLRQYIADYHGGHPDLAEAFTTGKLGNGSLLDPNGEANRQALNRAQEILDSGAGPRHIKIEKHLTYNLDTKSADAQQVTGTVRWLFGQLVGNTSNYLDRSPEMRIAYWDEVPKLVDGLSPEARATLAETVSNPNVRLMPGQKDRVLSALHNATATTGVDAEAAHEILSGRAFDSMMEAIHQYHTQSNIADALRIVFPFGDAFAQILGRWARAYRDYPQIFRRTQQLVQGAREASFDPVTGLPTGHDGEGFFRYDPVTKQEVFTYPGSDLLTQGLLGVPVPLKGSVRGLNIVGEGIPAVGPGVSIPASWFLPDKPSFDKIKEHLFPYGAPTGNLLDKAEQQVIPAWMKRVITASSTPQGDRLYNNTVMDVARYLNSTGDYHIQGKDGPSELNRLLHDAKEKTPSLFLIRAGATLGSPASPMFDFYAKDKTGNLMLAQKAIDDYQRMKDKYGLDKAFDRFLAKYGTDNLFLTQSKSNPEVAGLSPTKEQRAWERDHPEIVDQYPTTWALWAPKGTTYDQTAYNAQLDTGQRSSIPVSEMVQRANNRLATAAYRHAQQTAQSAVSSGGAKTTTAEADALRTLRTNLRQQVPGYQSVPTVDAKTQLQIDELTRALTTEPHLANTDAGRGLIDYLRLRQQAFQAANQGGLTTFVGSDRAAPLRDWLRTVAQQVIANHPGFKRMWDSVLASEIGTD